MKKNKTEKLFILLGCEKYDKIVVQKMKEIHETTPEKSPTVK